MTVNFCLLFPHDWLFLSSCYILTSCTCFLFAFALSPLRMHHLWTIFLSVLTITLPLDAVFLLRYIDTLHSCKTQDTSLLLCFKALFHGRFSHSNTSLPVWRTVDGKECRQSDLGSTGKQNFTKVSSGQDQPGQLL